MTSFAAPFSALPWGLSGHFRPSTLGVRAFGRFDLAALPEVFGLFRSLDVAFGPVTSAETASRAMARYAKGDDSAFGDVYDALSQRLFSYLRRLARSETIAEDLLQQTFLRMHHARARFHDGADVVPWAYAIARRIFLDHARTAKRFVPSGSLDAEAGAPPSPLPDAEAVLAAFELSTKLDAELEAMPAILREAFLLVRDEGMSMAQAADALGVSVSAVKIRAHRAYERLRAVAGEKKRDEEAS